MSSCPAATKIPCHNYGMTRRVHGRRAPPGTALCSTAAPRRWRWWWAWSSSEGLATLRRKMGHFDGTAAFHGESAKTASRPVGHWPKTPVLCQGAYRICSADCSWNPNPWRRFSSQRWWSIRCPGRTRALPRRPVTAEDHHESQRATESPATQSPERQPVCGSCHLSPL